MRKPFAVLIGLFLVSVSCTREPVVHPVLGRDAITSVLIAEDQGEALERWARMRIKGAALVNLDMHDALCYIPEEKVRRLRRLYENKQWDEFGRARGGGDKGLYGWDDFIFAAHGIGMVSEVYWIIPFPHFSSEDGGKSLTSLLENSCFSKADIEGFHISGGCLKGVKDGIPLAVCGTEALPDIDVPVLFSVDMDFIVTAAKEYGMDKLSITSSLFTLIFRKNYRVMDAVVSYSVNGDFVPVQDRWLGDVAARVMAEPDIIKHPPPELWRTRQLAEGMLKVDDFKGLTFYVDPVETTMEGVDLLKVQEYRDDPVLRLYAALGYQGQGNSDKAYAHAMRACMVDRGYCGGLAYLATEILELGDDRAAEEFFTSAYDNNPEMFVSMVPYAHAMERAGRTDEAIKWYERYNEWAGAFPAGFMIGGIYIARGNDELAIAWFDRALAALKSDECAVVDRVTADAIGKAINLYERRGMHGKASLLRREPRLRAVWGVGARGDFK